MADLARLVVRLEAENSKLVEGLNKSTRELNKFRTDAEGAIAGVGSAFKGLAAIGLSAVSIAAVASSIKDVVNRADDFSKLSQKVGVGVEALSALAYAADLSGVSTEALGAGLKRLSANVADTARGTGDARDAFKALGINVRDASGGIKSADKLLAEIATKFAGAEDGVNKTAIAMKLFGKSGADLIPMLNEGAAGLEQMRIEAKQLGIVLSDETVAAAEEFNDNLTRLGFAADGLKISIAEKILPGLTDVTKAMAQAAKDSDLLMAAWVGLGGLGALLFTEEFDSNVKKLRNLQIELSQLQRHLRDKNDQGLLHDLIHGDELKLQSDIDDVVAKISALRDKMGAAAKSTASVGAAANSSKTQLAGLKTETKGLTDAQKAAKKEQDDYNRRFQSLLAAIDPISKKSEDYMQAVADLDRAWIDGNISGEEHDRLLMELATNYDAIKDAAEKAIKAEKEAAAEREKIAKENAAAMAKPFEHAAEGIQDSFTEAFQNIFAGNVDSFEDFADQIKNVFTRLAAEIATLLVFNPQASFGSVAGGLGIFGSTAANAAGTGGSIPNVPGASSFATMGGGYGGAVLGGLGGAYMGYQQGGVRGAAVGAGVGYLGGAAVTSGATALAAGWGASASGGAALAGASSALAAIPVWGWAALAALAIFGSGKKMPSNKSAFGAIDLGTGTTSGFGNQTGDKFSQETVTARDAFFTAIKELSTGLTKLTGGKIRGSIHADIGQRDGTQVFGSFADRNFGGQKNFADPKAALTAIFDAMLDGMTGVSAEFRKVFDKLDTRNIDKAVKDLSTAAYIINKDYVQKDPLSPVRQALKDIDTYFDPIIRQAQRLGLAVRPIQAEENKAKGKLRTDFNNFVDDSILASTNPLQSALNEFNDQAKIWRRDARVLGADLVDLEEMIAIKRAEIIERYGDQANAGLLAANKNIEQFLTGVRSGSASFLSPAATLANAEADFGRLAGLAKGDDATAVQARADIVGAAENLRSASREAWGSSTMFFERDNFIQSTLSNLVGQNNTTAATFDNIGITIAQGNATMEYQLKQVVDELKSLRQAYDAQQAALNRMASA